MSDYCDPDIFEVTKVKARKTHFCSECRIEITPRSYYERAEGLWDGHWSRYKTCLMCLSLRYLLKDKGIDWGFGDVRDIAAQADLISIYNFPSSVQHSKWLHAQESEM